MCLRALMIGLLFLSTLSGSATAEVTTDRITILTDDHGYFPCMDCHADQEPVATPRILEEDHEVPFEWEDADGVVHVVALGDRVAIADLLGSHGRTDLDSQDLARIGERLQIAAYMEMNGLAPEDSVWTLVHGGGSLWCLDCHDMEDRDKLVRLDGELLTFNESHLLCRECHGPKYRDWDLGIHGSTTGYWDQSRDQDGVTVRKVCVECHSPHSPSFAKMTPLAGPIPRIDGPGPRHEGGAHE